MELLDSPGKSEVILEYASKFPDITTFVETGTASGDQACYARDHFLDIVTIEMDSHLYNGAMHRLLPFNNIRVVWGDSERMLSHVLQALDRPCIVFLDAHEVIPNGRAAMALEMVALAHDPHEHVVLVDDVRLCADHMGWLSEGKLKEYAKLWGYGYRLEADIARLTP